MLTGVEIAGIVLAVMPLCITILENHQAEIQPLKNLLKFRAQYAKSCEDLEIRLQQLDMMMDKLFVQAGISTDGQGIASLVAKYDSRVWAHGEKQQKLINYLSPLAYQRNFELVMKRIRTDVADIASILNLGSYGESEHDAYIWNTLKKAKQENDNFGRHSRLLEKEIKTRTKFVFKGGKMEHKLRNMKVNMDLLDSTIENKAKLRQMESSTTMSGRHLPLRSPFPIFAPHLTNIVGHARRLHGALQRIRNCSRCGRASINLRLDKRLGSSNRHYSPEEVKFTLACELCFPKQITWKFLEVSMLSSITPLNQTHCNQSVTNLCYSMDNIGALAHFSVNKCDEVIRQEDHELLQPDTARPAQISSFISIGELFRSRRIVSDNGHAAMSLSNSLTMQRSISLGSDIVSAILQLSGTSWIQNVWDCEKIFFPSTDTGPTNSVCYVRVSVTSNTPAQPGNSAYRGEAFVRLATTLIEVALQTPISTLAPGEPILTIQTSRTITGLERDVAVLRRIIERNRGNIQPCMQEAVGYCLTAFRNPNADMASADTQSEMIREVLAPLEADLQNW